MSNLRLKKLKVKWGHDFILTRRDFEHGAIQLFVPDLSRQSQGQSDGLWRSFPPVRWDMARIW